jgi:hypothetical protein
MTCFFPAAVRGMSALGQKRTCALHSCMSALGQKRTFASACLANLRTFPRLGPFVRVPENLTGAHYDSCEVAQLPEHL